MRQNQLALFIAIAMLNLAAPTPVHGAIKYFRFFKNTSSQQTSNAQPVTADFAWANLDVLFDNVLDLNTAKVTAASPLSPITLNSAGPGYSPPFSAFTFSTFYSTVASLTTDYPNSTAYQFAVNGGVLGNLSSSLTSPASNLFPSIPYFNGSTFSR